MVITMLNHDPGWWLVVADHHWTAIVTAVGAAIAAGGVLAGAIFAAHYGRRASVCLSAEATPTAAGVVITARPVVRAVGIFRVRFHPDKGSGDVELQEVYLDSANYLTYRHLAKIPNVFGVVAEKPVQRRDGRRAKRAERRARAQFVEAGEELTTTVTFQPVPPTSVTSTAIGWQVYFRAEAGQPKFYRLRRSASSSWMDQVFVPRCEPKKGLPS